jgi:hypothetical protein
MFLDRIRSPRIATNRTLAQRSATPSGTIVAAFGAGNSCVAAFRFHSPHVANGSWQVLVRLSPFITPDIRMTINFVS